MQCRFVSTNIFGGFSQNTEMFLRPEPFLVYSISKLLGRTCTKSYHLLHKTWKHCFQRWHTQATSNAQIAWRSRTAMTPRSVTGCCVGISAWSMRTVLHLLSGMTMSMCTFPCFPFTLPKKQYRNKGLFSLYLPVCKLNLLNMLLQAVSMSPLHWVHWFRPGPLVYRDQSTVRV